jgi:hypothetical protein
LFLVINCTSLIVSRSRSKMSINSLMILSVESQYNQEYIANVFWKQHIAKVSSITLIPYLKNSEVYSIAYIVIDEWCDSEVSYNFIQRLNNPSRENRVIHKDENWWLVEINTHNNGDIYVGDYTLKFNSSYFVRNMCAKSDEFVSSNEYQDYSCNDEEFDELILQKPDPDKCIGNEYYFADKDIEQLRVLTQELEYLEDHTPYTMLYETDEHRIRELINNIISLRESILSTKSRNVTLRGNQFGKRNVAESNIESVEYSDVI